MTNRQFLATLDPPGWINKQLRGIYRAITVGDKQITCPTRSVPVWTTPGQPTNDLLTEPLSGYAPLRYSKQGVPIPFWMRIDDDDDEGDEE